MKRANNKSSLSPRSRKKDKKQLEGEGVTLPRRRVMVDRDRADLHPHLLGAWKGSLRPASPRYGGPSWSRAIHPSSARPGVPSIPADRAAKEATEGASLAPAVLLRRRMNRVISAISEISGNCAQDSANLNFLQI